jgi:hypothetical protein
MKAQRPQVAELLVVARGPMKDSLQDGLFTQGVAKPAFAETNQSR